MKLIISILVLLLPTAGALFLLACSSVYQKTSPIDRDVHYQDSGLILNELALAVADNYGHTQTALTTLLGDVDYEEPRSVLKYILQSVKSPSIIYPTERYYYYQFALGARKISGNIRFAEVEDGVVTVGYFDSMHTADMRFEELKDGDPGVSIEYDAKKYNIKLTVDSISRVFLIDQSAFTTPTFSLYEGETLISGVRDESGYYFHLLYWANDRSFYYIVNESMPIPETLQKIPHPDLELYFGVESRFCFYRHPRSGRLVLVGVHRRNVQLNTWYDGPFDQVPPYLMIRDILEEAYPYVIDAGGIDDHGKFLKKQSQRVAISPYIAYRSGFELVQELEVLIRQDDRGPIAWTGATYEYKKDWRPPSSLMDKPIMHNFTVSKQWPANHWGNSSRSWGGEHKSFSSRQWPPNHYLIESQNKIDDD